MEARHKTYCPWCGERIRHSTHRCPYCKQFILTPRRMIIYILISIVIVTAAFLLLDYFNIEFFK